MKKIFITILCLGILYSCKPKREITVHSNQSEEPGNPSNQSEYLKFKGMLVEELFLTDPCGSINNAITFKFTINQILEGSYESKEILIIHPCPELKGKDFFSENTVYIIEASILKKSNLNFQIYNYYKSSKLPQYWSISIAKITNE